MMFYINLKNEIKTLNSYLKQDNVVPPPQHNIIMFELDSDVKFPLLRLLQFLSDLKSTIFLRYNNIKYLKNL